MTLAPFLRNGLFVAAFNVGIAALLAAVKYGDGFWVNLLYSQCIGLSGWVLIDGGRRLLWPEPYAGASFWVLVAVALVIATLGGVSLAALLLGHPLRLDDYLTSLVIATVAGLVAVLYFIERSRKEEVQRLAAESQLKLLQAQVEPHFLFNTLANLHALIPADPKRAQAMLDHLNGYLRAALAAARRERSTLGDEFALLGDYLEILAIRMGERLRYRLELPAALAGAQLPPMLLQPLVENAVKHGLEPRVGGGEITVSAGERGARLVLEVRDSGLGLGAAATSGTGAGIAQVRERLAALYGAGASLEVSDNPAGGVTAALSLPLAR
jgi:signal transduction histidine kinase